MADLRAEQIMDALQTAITSLTTTGANVIRAQAYPSEDTELPGLALYMGPDTPVQHLQSGFIDWELEVVIQSRVKEANTQIDQTLNLIRKEVHVALLTDRTQGLAFVSDTEPGPAGRPQLDNSGEQPSATQELAYVIRYRTSETDLSA